MLIIPYGIEALPDGDAVGCEARAALPFPYEAIDTGAGEVLRLNNGRYHLDSPASPQIAAGTELFEAIKQHLISLCGTWSRLPQRFLEYYFGEVQALVEEAREELARRLSPYQGLFTYEDWRFSAVKPLPRAFLNAPDAREPGAYVQVEFAFWLGDRLIALQSEPCPLTPRVAALRRERLARANIECFGYRATDLVPGRRELMARILGERGLAFWSDEVLPTGPFRPELQRPA